MDDVEGARTFEVEAGSYDSFMGRYSGPLAVLFADAAGVRAGGSAVDVGSGPGALTGVLVERLGAGSVAACDPSLSFVAACAARHPGADVRAGRAESVPFDDASFDHGLSQLVWHFVSDPAAAAAELCRVVRPGGTVGACVWDFADGMQMLRRFWDAAVAVDVTAPDEARTMRFGKPGEIAEVFERAGATRLEESTLQVSTTYRDFAELWSGFLAGAGPAGTFCTSLAPDDRRAVEQELFARVGSPSGAFTLSAVARCAVGRVAERP